MSPLSDVNLLYAAVDGYVSYELYHKIKSIKTSLQRQPTYCCGCLAKERSMMKRKEVDDGAGVGCTRRWDDDGSDGSGGWDDHDDGGRKQQAGASRTCRKVGDGSGWDFDGGRKQQGAGTIWGDGDSWGVGADWKKDGMG